MLKIYKQHRDVHGGVVWKIVVFGCQYCSRKYKKEIMCARHEEECKNINTLKQEGNHSGRSKNNKRWDNLLP